MKGRLPAVAGAVLGLLFVVFGLNFFLEFIAVPPPPEGSLSANMDETAAELIRTGLQPRSRGRGSKFDQSPPEKPLR